jgi:hypothetical protein
MNSTNPPTRAPTASDLLDDPIVQAAMQQAWIDSFADDPNARHEEGGWIYTDTTTGQTGIRRAPTGTTTSLDLGNPPMVPGSVVVGTFHTHPNPTADGWDPGPSPDDQYGAQYSGVPWLIQADDGTHTTGPASRRGGLTGDPGYPS